MFSGAFKPWHLILVVVVLVLLFGAKRLPGAARSLGRSMRILKAETKGLVDEPEPDDLDEKADARTSRRPLPRDAARDAADEVADPVERVRDK
jgi:sec-independent protein translocase protein TatA